MQEKAKPADRLLLNRLILELEYAQSSQYLSLLPSLKESYQEMHRHLDEILLATLSQII